ISAIKQDVQAEGIRAVIIEKGGMLELWYGVLTDDPNTVNWTFFTGDSSIDYNSPLGLKSHTIFWLDKNKQTIFGYFIDEQSIFGKSMTDESDEEEPYLEFQNGSEGLWRAVFDPINNKFNYDTKSN
ncbi:MAG: hypothetical protein Q8N56_02075, partial [bacterium]|nr:hypothetical protein [bacterium]